MSYEDVSFFVNKRIPDSDAALLHQKTIGLASTAEKMLSLVSDYSVIDLSRLPPASFIREQYEKDSQAQKGTIDKLCEIYEKKIDMCRKLQLGM